MTSRFVGARLAPTMRKEDLVNVGLAIKFDIITSLQYIHSIILSTDPFIGGADMFVNLGDDKFCYGSCVRGNCKVIYLSADKNNFSFDLPTINIALMSSRLEAKNGFKNVYDHFLP